MAEIPGVTVDWVSSPRIIYIPLIIRTVSAQDLVDTLRALESNLDALDDVEPLVFEATGKTALDGSGTVVGITLVLMNAQLYFIPDNTPIGQGLATANSSATGRSILLFDTNSTFQTLGLERGQTIVNGTTGAIATIISVPSETSLESVFLTGGSRDTWLIGDIWIAYDQQQCVIEGGNVVAIDDPILQNLLTPVLGAANTQVIRSSSSSATLQELESVQFSSYNNGVTLNTGSVYSGTTFPVGTAQQPVNNIADAILILAERGLAKIFLQSNVTLTSGNLIGVSLVAGRSDITVILAGANITGGSIEGCIVAGAISPGCSIRRCALATSSYSGGYLEQVSITGTVTLLGSNAVLLLSCIDLDPGAVTPIFDMAFFTGDLSIRAFYGGLELQNKTTANTVAIDLASGRLVVRNSCTAGTIRVRGIGEVVIESGVTTVVNTTSLISNDSVSTAIWNSTQASPNTHGAHLQDALAKIVQVLALARLIPATL